MSSPSANISRPRGLLLQMAIRDLLHDRQVALCIIFSLVAVITPLLLLFGLKNGVVTQLRHELTDDPRTLEVRMIGNGNYDLAWLERLENHPQVGFAIPLTRSLNTQGDLVKDSAHFVAGAEVIPTAKGDPLLAGLSFPTNEQQAILSASAAHRLQAKAGDSFRLVITRKRDGVNERSQHQLTVSAVLAESKFSRPGIFVTLPLLVALEDYRDGYQVPLLGVTAGKAARQRHNFARARLYARSLDDVAGLARWLEEQHIESVTQQAQIESVRAIDRMLGTIFAVIAWISVLGCVASLVGAFMANIDRKRRDMAVLRLIGFRRSAVTLFVLVQVLLLTGVAFNIGLLLYLLGSLLFNQLLGASLPGQAFVCHLSGMHLLLALLSVLLVALGVAAIGAARALKIEPAESLREI